MLYQLENLDSCKIIGTYEGTSERHALDFLADQIIHAGRARLRMTAYTMHELCNRPLSANGLTSYRYKGPYGWIMIGAHDTEGALMEAARSTDAKIECANLQIYNYEKGQYIDIM